MDGEYIYIPVEKFNPIYWLNKLDEKIYEFDESNKEAVRNAAFDGIKSIANDWGVAAWNWFVSITPELVGYTALITGGLIMLSPLVNRGILRPLGAFGAVGLIGVSVIGAS